MASQYAGWNRNPFELHNVLRNVVRSGLRHQNTPATACLELSVYKIGPAPVTAQIETSGVAPPLSASTFGVIL